MVQMTEETLALSHQCGGYKKSGGINYGNDIL